MCCVCDVIFFVVSISSCYASSFFASFFRTQNKNEEVHCGVITSPHWRMRNCARSNKIARANFRLQLPASFQQWWNNNVLICCFYYRNYINCITQQKHWFSDTIVPWSLSLCLFRARSLLFRMLLCMKVHVLSWAELNHEVCIFYSYNIHCEANFEVNVIVCFALNWKSRRYSSLHVQCVLVQCAQNKIK